MEVTNSVFQRAHARKCSSTPLFLTPRSIPLLRHRTHGSHTACVRRLVQARLNRGAKSLVVTAGLLCVSLIPKFRDRVPVAYRKSAPHAAAIALVAAGVVSRVRAGGNIVVKRGGGEAARGESDNVVVEAEEDDKEEWGGKMEDVTSDTDTQLREAFSSSRAEWGDDDNARGGWKSKVDGEFTGSSTYSYSFKRSRKGEGESRTSESKTSAPEDEGYREEIVGEWDRSAKRRTTNRKRDSDELRKESLNIVSGGDLMKRFASIPGYVVREVVVPVSEIGSVLWYDVKMGVLEGVAGGDERYFMDDDGGDDGGDGADNVEMNESNCDTEHEMEEQLSVEERQMLEMQRGAMRAARGVEDVTKQVQGSVMRLLGRMF